MKPATREVGHESIELGDAEYRRFPRGFEAAKIKRHAALQGGSVHKTACGRGFGAENRYDHESSCNSLFLLFNDASDANDAIFLTFSKVMVMP